MLSLSASLVSVVIALTLALAFANGALADDVKKPNKHKKAATNGAKVEQQRRRGTSAFPPGPVYFGNDYLGDDPDPFIRQQLLRDLGAHYGPPD
jgi:hypothetical protein